jgi:hypothetical protein
MGPPPGTAPTPTSNWPRTSPAGLHPFQVTVTGIKNLVDVATLPENDEVARPGCRRTSPPPVEPRTGLRAAINAPTS